MNIVEEYLNNSNKVLSSYWEYCLDLAMETLKWAKKQHNINDDRLKILVMEDPEMKTIYPNITAKGWRPLGAKLKGWSFHVALFDGEFVHDAWSPGKHLLSNYLIQMFPNQKTLFLSYGGVQQVVDLNKEIKLEEREVVC